MRVVSFSIEEVSATNNLAGQETEFDLSVCSFGIKTKTIHKSNKDFCILLSLVSLLEPITEISVFLQNSKTAVRNILGNHLFSKEKAIINVQLNGMIESSEEKEVLLNDVGLVVHVRYSSGYTEEKKLDMKG